MANKPTPDKTAKVSPGQTQGKATRSRRELKKKLKKAGHVAIAATELEKPVRDQWGKTKGETLRGAQGRDKKRQNTIVPKAITQRAASNKTNLIMAAKMCKDPVQMSMRDVSTDFLDPFHQWSSQKVGDAYLKRMQPVDWFSRDTGCRGAWCFTSAWRCASRLGSAGTDAAGYAVAWSALGFIGEGLHRNTYIGSYVAGPKRGRRCVVKRLKGERGAHTGDQMPDFLRQDIGVSDVCICLAGEFNKLQQNNRTRTLRFNKYLALRVGSAGRLSGFAPGEWVTVEDYYPGGFEKLVANSGVVAYENNRGSLATFSHWTYHRTQGKFLVTDIQGVRPKLEEIYLLTDPAIHSVDERGGCLDHGESGILNFFATHECTSRCKDLLRPRVSEEELRKRRDRVAKRPGGWRMAKGDSDEEEKDPASKPPSFAHAQRETRLIFQAPKTK